MFPCQSRHPFSVSSLSRLVLLVAFTSAPLTSSSHAESASGSERSHTRSWALKDLIPENTAPTYPGLRPAHLLSTDSLHLVWDDTRSIFTAPLRWDRDDWVLAGTLGTVVFASAGFDHQIKVEAQENRSPESDNFAKNFQNLGSSYSWIVLGGMAAWGEFGHNEKAQAVAIDGLTSSIIASGLISPILKYSIGRVRPNAAARTFEFKPFSGNLSFPSGHTTQAFVLATTIASHYPQWWVQVIAYGSAGMVGYCRIQQNAHFASDVFAGAAIGWSVTRAVVNRHNAKPNPTAFKLSPYADGHHTGLMFSKNF